MKAGFVLGAVALAAAAGYTMREVSTDRKEIRRRESEGRVFIVTPEEVTAIAVSRPGETVRLERGSGGWTMLSPKPGKTDAETMSELLRLVSAASTSRTIEEAPSEPARYGFGAQATQVEVTTRAGRHAVEVGLEAPTEEGVYVRRPGSPAILLADAEMRDLSQVDAQLLAERTLLPEAAKATRFDVRGRTASTILRLVDGAWYVSEPFQFPADRQRVGTFLDTFATARRQPPPRTVSLEEAGLSPARVEVSFFGPEGMETIIRFGAPEGENTLWAAIGEEPPFLVPASIGGILREEPEDWSERRPAAVDRYKVTRVKLRLKDQVVDVRKDASGWRNAQGRQLAEGDVLALVAALCDTPGELVSRTFRSARQHPSLAAEVEEEGGRRQTIEGFGPEEDGGWLLRPKGFHPLLRIPASAIDGLRARIDALQGSGPAAPPAPAQ